MKSGIYTITSPSGRLYIGSAVNFSHRWRVHLYNLRRKQHHSPALQNAYDKYGEPGLVFRKLLICAPADLLFYEQRAIDAYASSRLYNVSPVAGSQLGFRHSDATKAAYAAARKGRGPQLSVETRRKIANARRGKKLSVQARANQSAAQKGRPKSAAHVAKVAAANRGQKRSAAVCRAMSEQRANRPCGPNASGFVGVSRKGDKWQARASQEGRRVYLGYYPTAETAAEAVRQFLENGSVPPP